MHNLSIDIETFSSVDLSKCGVYKYASSPDFEILLFGYSLDGREVCVIDIANGENIPREILAALEDDNVTKWAFNAQFERICLSHYLGCKVGEYLSPVAWKCTMVWSAYMGLPLSLEGAGSVLGIEKQKLSEGKDLIRYFCVPCKPTKVNGARTRNLPIHDKEKWQSFKEYNLRDVETEMQIQQKLSKFPVPYMVWNEYHLDQQINDRGIALDMVLVNQATQIDGISRESIINHLKYVTGLENPNSVLQMREWLSLHGMETDTLDKKAVSDLLKTASKELAEVLILRQQLAKSSVKKYKAMENAVCEDGRARGMFQFYGANRTGRFSGRLIQLQNLPQNHIPDLEQARALVRIGDFEALEMLYNSVPEVLSELIRTAFVPKNGCKYIVADFSAIEARVIAWFADEQWRLDVFEHGGDIYCASASQMFSVPVEKNGINSHLRQKGKIAELALGYGGSVGALKSMGALEMGLAESELQGLVNSWRDSNHMITKFWWDIDRAVKTVVKEHISIKTYGLEILYKSGMLFIKLPSGRQLSYVKPRIGENIFGGESVTYEGVGATKKWERLESYGPKFVENIVQGTARDILCYALENLSQYNIVAHVHDEIIIEANSEMSLDDICNQMGQTPPWAENLKLLADGYKCDFYKKE